jgi:hypothetical protein
MPTLVATEKRAIQPDIGQVVHRSEAQPDRLAFPAPGQVKAGLVPGETQIIPQIGELIVPTGGHGNGTSAEAVEPTIRLAQPLFIDAEIPVA